MKIIEELDFQPNILASSLASKKNLVFATLLPEPPSIEGYWSKPFSGILKKINEIRQYGISIKSFTYNQLSALSFSTEAKKILGIHPDGVILAPFFYKESLAFISGLKQFNIPFVFIDSEIKDAGQLCYIGQNSFRSGMVSGKLLDLLTQGEGKIMVLHFGLEMDNQNHLAQREQGFYEWFNQKGTQHRIFTFEIHDTGNSHWTELLFRKITGENVKGIFVTNSRVYLIGQMIQEYRLNKLKVIGHDLLNENIEYLRDGTVDFLLCQHPEEQGYNAVNKLFRHLIEKQEVEKENYTSIDIVTKETIDFYKEF